MTTSTVVPINSELSANFKSAMRRLAATVTIITAKDGNACHGMTATAVTSLTATPPSLLACVNQSASIHHPIGNSGQYCINLLGCDHSELVSSFSGHLTGEERFSSGTWAKNDDGIPYLIDAQANIFCTVVQTIKHESHTIFIGHVNEVLVQGETSPLLYQEGMLFRSMAL
jgi:flavin reductase (DIM6/NTAB) family NADH-FMN oxidoreductase RutF